MLQAARADNTHTRTTLRDSDSFPGSEALAVLSKLEELRLNFNRGGLTAIPGAFRVWSNTLKNLDVSDVTSLTGKHYVCAMPIVVYSPRVAAYCFAVGDRELGAVVVKGWL